MKMGQFLTGFLCAFLVGCGGGDGPAADPNVLSVFKPGDDGSEGTLRWAIQKSNQSPGQYTIQVGSKGNETLIIKPSSELPAIIGPAKILGAWSGSGSPTVVLDGSGWLNMSDVVAPGLPKACPGENPGQYGPNARMIRNVGLKVRDSKSVEIAGFEVRNFCIGIMLHRSSNNFVHHMRLYKNVGTSGILLTGDDETAAGGATVGRTDGNRIEDNYFLNNPDGLDTSRGVSNTTIRRNTLIIDTDGFPSSGMEATSDGLIVEDNVIQGYATGLIVYGADNAFRRNKISDNALAVQHFGGTRNLFEENVVKDNRAGMALTARGAQLTLTKNQIFGNGKDISICGPNNTGTTTSRDGGVCREFDWLTSQFSINMTNLAAPAINDMAADCSDALPDCNLPQNRPEALTASWSSGGYVIGGQLASRPNEKFLLEFFASRSAGPLGKGEGEVFVGTQEVVTDAAGSVKFSFASGAKDPLKDGTKTVYFTAIATRVSNKTSSDFSMPQSASSP